MGGIVSCCTNQNNINPTLYQVKTSEGINKVITNNDILYKSTSKGKCNVTKVCIIQSDKIEYFFNSQDMFLITTKHNNTRKNYFYNNVHISNFLQNKDYIIIYLQSDLSSQILPSDTIIYKITSINFGSTNLELIKEQLYIDLNSMIALKFYLKGIIYVNNNKYQMLFIKNKKILKEEIKYYIDIYESSYMIPNLDDIKNIVKRVQNKNYKLVTLFRYFNSEQNGIIYIVIYKNNEINENKESEKQTDITETLIDNNNIIEFSRGQNRTEEYLSKLSDECSNRGSIYFVIDSQNCNFVIFN